MSEDDIVNTSRAAAGGLGALCRAFPHLPRYAAPRRYRDRGILVLLNHTRREETMDPAPETAPGLSRRDFLAAGVGVSGLAAVGGLLSACKVGSGSGDSASLKVGFVSPRTGPAAGFGEPDAHVLGLARKAL